VLRSDILHSKPQILPVGRDRSSASRKRAARELLLLCTAASISPAGKAQISQILGGEIDWKYLLELAEFHGVAPIVAHNLVTNGFTGQVQQSYLERLNHIYVHNLYRNVLLSSELAKVLSVLKQHGVVAIILKGTILAELLYGNPGLRRVADMDIMVQPGELSLTRSLLLEMGYRQPEPLKVWDHPFHEVPYYKTAKFPFFIELHWNLDDERLVAFPRQEIWQRAHLVESQGWSTMVLSPEDTLLYLCNNLSKQDDQLLRSVCDIAELLKKYEGTLDWDYIRESARSWKIGPSLCYSLELVQGLLGVQVPVSLIEALKPKA
jgi:hypothetical protein